MTSFLPGWGGVAFLRDKLAVTPVGVLLQPTPRAIWEESDVSSSLRSSSTFMGDSSSLSKWTCCCCCCCWSPFLLSREQATAWDFAFFMGEKWLPPPPEVLLLLLLVEVLVVQAVRLVGWDINWSTRHCKKQVKNERRYGDDENQCYREKLVLFSLACFNFI